jgi:hypothetical protein
MCTLKLISAEERLKGSVIDVVLIPQVMQEREESSGEESEASDRTLGYELDSLDEEAPSPQLPSANNVFDGDMEDLRASLSPGPVLEDSDDSESRVMQGLEAGSSKTAKAHALVRLNSSSVLPSDSTRPLIYNDIASDASDPDYGGSPIRRCAFSCRSKTL